MHNRTRLALCLLLCITSCAVAEAVGDGIAAVSDWVGGDPEPPAPEGGIGGAAAGLSSLMKAGIGLLIVLAFLAPSPAKILAAAIAKFLTALFRVLFFPLILLHERLKARQAKASPVGPDPAAVSDDSPSQ